MGKSTIDKNLHSTQRYVASHSEVGEQDIEQSIEPVCLPSDNMGAAMGAAVEQWDRQDVAHLDSPGNLLCLALTGEVATGTHDT